MLLLCADIGGTNARFQLFDDLMAPLASDQPRLDRRYPTPEFSTLELLLRRFLTDAELLPRRGEVIAVCCLAVCTPVENERRICGAGGVDWDLDVVRDVERGPLGDIIRRCVLINDFVAVGLGLQSLTLAEQTSLHAAPMQPRAPCMCLGPGTGLGTCFLTWDVDVGGYVAHAAEGGMVEFGARTAEQWGLREFLRQEQAAAAAAAAGDEAAAQSDAQPSEQEAPIIVEDVVSGPGLGHCYRYLSSCRGLESEQLDLRATTRELPAMVAQVALASMAPEPDTITQREEVKTVPSGLGRLDTELCLAALDLWLGAFVDELRAAALRFLPLGGLFIAGGVASKLMPWLGEAVAARFADQDLNVAVLRTVPVILVDDSLDVGLLGARVRAAREQAATRQRSAL